MRRLLAIPFYAIGAICWFIGDIIFDPDLALGLVMRTPEPKIPEPPCGEQDTRPYDVDATQQIGR